MLSGQWYGFGCTAVFPLVLEGEAVVSDELKACESCGVQKPATEFITPSRRFCSVSCCKRYSAERRYHPQGKLSKQKGNSVSKEQVCVRAHSGCCLLLVTFYCMLSQHLAHFTSKNGSIHTLRHPPLPHHGVKPPSSPPLPGQCECLTNPTCGVCTGRPTVVPARIDQLWCLHG